MYFISLILGLIQAAIAYTIALFKNDRVALIIAGVFVFIGWVFPMGTLYWLGVLAYLGVLIIAERTGQALDIEKDFMRAIKVFRKAETVSAAGSANTAGAAPQTDMLVSGNTDPAQTTPTTTEPVQTDPVLVEPEPVKEPVKPPADAPKAKPEMPKAVKKGVSFIGEFLSKEGKQSEDVLDIAHIEATVKAKIKGQDHAIDTIVNTLKRVAAGIRTKPESPLSVFLFVGPTGTGKTEIVKQISEATGRPMVRFDMPNYSTEAGIWELIGSPPGYVGSDKSGRLTGEIQANPNAVLLLDEIEKAHPKMWDPFLRVLDEGKLRDQSKGFTANFKNVLIFLTSNLMAFEEWTEDETALRNKLLNEGYFRPELINRIDRIVMFKQFTKEILSGIVANMVIGFAERFAASNKIEADIKIDRNLIEHVIKNVDLKFGVRDAERFVEKHVGDAVAEAYLKVVGKPIEEVRIGVINDKVEVKIS